MKPRPADLVALVALLPPAAIVLSFDLETCAAPGGDARAPGRARVVQFGIAAFSAEPLPGVGGEPVTVVSQSRSEADEDGLQVAGYVFAEATNVDPEHRIDAASQSKHKITDAMVRDAPTVADLADDLLAWLRPAGEDGHPRPLYLCGYNALRFDVPVLAAELRRVGREDVTLVLEATPLLDCMLIRKAAEPAMTLEGTCLRYGLGVLEGAHTADADSLANLAVLAAQAGHGHLRDVAAASGKAGPRPAPLGAVDSQGKLRWVDGKVLPAPTPDAVEVTFGKHQGKTLRQAGPGFSRWICSNEFDDDVKSAVRLAWGPIARAW